ncbi:MAG: hypothetical protein COA78_12390 [Blastopirellula sp.]|nr:MAG: hypothetical protein COA78_12390 [Blastopirellula sp.]
MTIVRCCLVIICIAIAGCEETKHENLTLSRIFISEKDGAEYLWMVIDSEDIYTGKYLAKAVYSNAPKAIQLAEKHHLKGTPLIKESSSSQGNIVFFIRDASDDDGGWYRAMTVDDLKKICEYTFEEFDNKHAGPLHWSPDQTIPEEVREIAK